MGDSFSVFLLFKEKFPVILLENVLFYIIIIILVFFLHYSTLNKVRFDTDVTQLNLFIGVYL